MSEPTQPDAGAPAAEPIAPPPEPSSTPPPPSDAPITAREAAALISAKPEPQSAPETDAAPQQESRSETEASEPPQEPLVPPRSWTKEDREAFTQLPREAQERILTRDREREADVHRSLREAAEQRKAAEVLAWQAEQAQAQARQQYEQNLPQKALLLDAQYREEFGTPTWAELKEWQRNDPLKYQAWDLAYKQASAAAEELKQQQAQQAQQQYQQQQEFLQNAETWKAEETRKFLEKAPEWKDPKAYPGLVTGVMNWMQQEIGFPREFLQRAATEHLPINIHDSRFQMMAWKGYLYDEAQKAAKSPARAPVPPVQRPGSAPNRGEAQEARFKDLTQQLDRTGSIKDGARLIAALNGARR